MFFNWCSYLQIYLWKWLHGDYKIGRFSALLLFFGLTLATIAQVQYKTGIEIFSFLPIDQRGFESFSEKLLENAFVSQAAASQPKTGKLFCWVMTTSFFHKTRVPAVNETWFQRCDASHFLTDRKKFLNGETSFHTVFEGLPASYFKLFWKTRLALYYVYKNISSDFDWYYKADDDTYAIIENLRDYLADFDPEKPYYFGFRLKRRAPEHGYNAGGSGYVLSKGAIKIFTEELFHDPVACPYHEWEDYAIARCLWNKGIYAHDTRDAFHRQRFLPWRPEQHYNSDLTRPFLMDPIEHSGGEIFHENLISMHHLSPEEIRLVHGMLYGVGPALFRPAEGLKSKKKIPGKWIREK